MNIKLAKQITISYQDHFGVNPDAVCFAPGRINFIGGHTDYNDGFVLPAAIDKGVFTAFGHAQDISTAVALDANNERLIFDFKFDLTISSSHWHRFIIGIISVLRSMGLQLKPFNVVFGGDLPQGGGLSSSAALENSLVLGLNHLFQLGLSKDEMILISQRVEHEFVGVQCGIMDQYASMLGKSGKAIFLDCRTLIARSVKLPLDGYCLMLINTKVKHQLSEDAYNDRRAACQAVANLAGVKALRDLTPKALDVLKDKIDPENYIKVKYVVDEMLRTQKAVEVIEAGDIISFGKLMFEAHEGLRYEYDVSCPEIDFFIDLAKQDSDIIGSRMMGGGFGGCTISIVRDSAYKRVAHEFSSSYLNQFGKVCEIHNVVLSDGARILNFESQ